MKKLLHMLRKLSVVHYALVSYINHEDIQRRVIHDKIHQVSILIAHFFISFKVTATFLLISYIFKSCNCISVCRKSYLIGSSHKQKNQHNLHDFPAKTFWKLTHSSLFFPIGQILIYSINTILYICKLPRRYRTYQPRDPVV